MTKAEIHIRDFGKRSGVFYGSYRETIIGLRRSKTGENKLRGSSFRREMDLENWKKGDLVDIEGNFSIRIDKEGIEGCFTVFPRNASTLPMERAREMKQAELAEGEEFTTDFEEDLKIYPSAN